VARTSWPTGLKLKRLERPEGRSRVRRRALKLKEEEGAERSASEFTATMLQLTRARVPRSSVGSFAGGHIERGLCMLFKRGCRGRGRGEQAERRRKEMEGFGSRLGRVSFEPPPFSSLHHQRRGTRTMEEKTQMVRPCISSLCREPSLTCISSQTHGRCYLLEVRARNLSELPLLPSLPSLLLPLTRFKAPPFVVFSFPLR